MAQGGDLLVTFSRLQQGQSDVAATASNLNTQLADLKAFLAPMVSTWTGQAAELYDAKQKQWDQAAADLNQVLAQIGTALGQAAADFQTAENHNAAVWGG